MKFRSGDFKRTIEDVGVGPAARAMRVTEATVYNWMNGKSEPRATQVALFLRKFKLDPASLFR